MKKLRVVSFAHAYPGTGFSAGGETTLHDLLVSLVDSGLFDVEFILSKTSNNRRGDFVIDGVQVREFTDQRQLRVAMTSADLAISHLGGAQRTSLVAKQNSVPSIHVCHNDLDYTKAMTKHAQFLVYNTLWVLDSFRNSRSPRPPGIVVRPPVDPGNYQVESSRRFLTLVNLADGEGGPYNKGPAVFYELAKRFPEEEFLGVLGAYGNQDIRELPNVTIRENTDDVKGIYAETKVVLSPSNYESYGRISVEAACSGIPSITSTAPGFVEHAVGHDRVDFRDVDGWEAALRGLLEPDRYEAASRVAQDKALDLWETSQVELKAFVEACHELAVRKKQRR